MTTLDSYRSKITGCLLGGAIGDALGGPVEFWDLDRIRRECGAGGVTEYVAEIVDGKPTYGRITDDTQMTLFTIEGMIRGSVRQDRGLGFAIGAVRHAYDRWLDTQMHSSPTGDRDGWLITEEWLYSRRAPGSTCLSALEEAREKKSGIPPYDLQARNGSKGCGGVMRSAPFGWLPTGWVRRDDTPFELAAQAAGFTHGHPTGKLASGAFAALIAALMRGTPLPEAVDTVLTQLSGRPHHEETTRAIMGAVDAMARPASSETIESLGGGWIAEEAFAMGLYAALVHSGPGEVLDALSLAVTHSGDSDSTGAICGNILGALHGESALPPELAFEVEGRGTILTLADDFVYEFTAHKRLHGDYGPYTRWTDRYPGW
ncbi:ADP-ribosylglycohydrolase family protein [Millisia brevis]|uniref:ADP-ribosylglycohydrolase family protein n=1 Tax=Millisia brevis TaxID=264148 RepID=UPI000829C695|nr:ADP-ribosylglycohydrolase family protein [Millisia brevis]